MRRLLTQHGLDYADDLKKNGKIPRPTNAEFVSMVAKAVKRVNQMYSKRTDPDFGEEIKTPVVRRSWELAGWIRGKPVNRKLAEIMSTDFSHLDARTAVDKIYNKSYATRLPKPSKLKGVRS